MTMVKICGLTNQDDAHWAWRSGADLLGFILVPSSPRHVDPQIVARIIETLRRQGCDIPTAGVFAGCERERLQEIVTQCGLDYVQLHGGESIEYAASIAAALETPYIRALHVDEGFSWDGLPDEDAWAYLLDTHDGERLGGTGRSWRWERAQEQEGALKRLIVAGGLTPDNVAQAVRIVRPWGVDVASGVEVAPGQKDPIKVHRFIRNVRDVDAQLAEEES